MNPLLRPFALWWRYWPQLVACYFVGMLVHDGAIAFAAWVGWDNQWWPALIMPVAALALLGSYVAMFLVLRHGIPTLADLARSSAKRVDVFTTIIVPFFAIYVAWQLFRQDWVQFETRALDYRVTDAFVTAAAGTPSRAVDFHADALPPSAIAWTLVAGALALRVVLGWLKNRLPRWLLAVRVYVDALWVFLVLTLTVQKGFAFLVKPTEWIAERRIVVWFTTTRAELFSHFQPVEIAWDAVVSAVQTVFGGAAIPLMWLAVAGIVYGATNIAGWRGAVRRTAGDRATELLDRAASARQQMRGRWGQVPGTLRKKVVDYARSQLGRFEPIIDSGRVVLHGGVFALSLYVLAYIGLSWLDMSGSFYGLDSGSGYLFRGAAWLIGPHPIGFWLGYADPLALALHALTGPLRVCLIASTFAYCVEHATKSQHDAQQDPPASLGDVDGGGHGVVGQQEGELQPTGLAALAGGAVGGRAAERADALFPPPAGPVEGEADAVGERRRPGPVDGDDE